MIIYSIRDRLANDLVGSQMYVLFCFRRDEQAIRYFADAMLDKTSVLNKHPNDYELIKIADINEEGEITSEYGPDIVITGTTLIATQTLQEKD